MLKAALTSSFNLLLLYNEANVKEGGSLGDVADMLLDSNCMFSTCGEGLDVQPDGSCYLRLGHRRFHVCLPEEKSQESQKMILFQYENRRCGSGQASEHQRG